MEQNQSDQQQPKTLVIFDEEVDRSPLSIGQRNFMKKMFNTHQSEVNEALKNHRDEVGKIFENYSKQVAESVGSQNKQTLTLMNEALAKVDKKFSNLYGTLINKFLVKQEEKVFLAELGVQALLEVTANRLHKLEQESRRPEPVDPEAFKEGFQKQVEDKITDLAEMMKKHTEEQMKKQAQGEVNNAEVPQEAATAEAAQPAQPSSD